jgi:hypothetical protein
MSRTTSLRRLAAILALGIIASCTPPGTEVVAPGAARGDIFDTYVAIGNSITAGWQSGGLVDSTQRRSYAFLLAQSMGTRFAYPQIAGRGCPPLVGNFQTQARTTGTSSTCDLRSATTATDILNNVAVPDAWSFDPTSVTSVNSNTLTSLILGGKTQVQRAVEARPTFVSVWIGNNDVLIPAISRGGTATSLATITTEAAFETNYNAITDALAAANPNIRGVLIGVVNVTNAPVMFAASAFSGTGGATFKAQFDAIACGGTPNSCSESGNTTLLDASCTSAPGNAALINTFLAHNIRSNAHPSFIACTPGGAAGTFPAPVGDAFILTVAEQATVTTAVNGYNTFISAEANDLGFAYYDPNPTLVTLRAAGTVIRQTPSYCLSLPACATPTAPFGTGMSLDGVHPAASVHLLVANAIIAAINAKYSITLPNVF